MFTNPSIAQIADLLRRARVIAVVGLSADPTRPSHRVAEALQGFGYRIIPVTPELRKRDQPSAQGPYRTLPSILRLGNGNLTTALILICLAAPEPNQRTLPAERDVIDTE